MNATRSSANISVAVSLDRLLGCGRAPKSKAAMRNCRDVTAWLFVDARVLDVEGVRKRNGCAECLRSHAEKERARSPTPCGIVKFESV